MTRNHATNTDNNSNGNCEQQGKSQHIAGNFNQQQQRHLQCGHLTNLHAARRRGKKEWENPSHRAMPKPTNFQRHSIHCADDRADTGS